MKYFSRYVGTQMKGLFILLSTIFLIIYVNVGNKDVYRKNMYYSWFSLNN